MSQENVEILRARFAAWNAGDMDALRELHDPDVIARYPEGWPEPGPFVGREAVMRQWEQQRETWDTDTIETISDFIDAGDRVVVRFIWRAVGHGPEATLEATTMNTVRNGRIIAVDFFWDHAEALETLGLSEQDAGLLSLRDTARAMSQENVELLYRGADAFNRRDLDAYLALMDDDVELMPRAVVLEGGDHYHGHGGVRRWWKDLFDVFPDFTTEVVDAQDLGNDLTLAHLRLRAHGAGSDTPTDESIWYVTRSRRGKCTWFRTFDTRAEALEAVGLSE